MIYEKESQDVEFSVFDAGNMSFYVSFNAIILLYMCLFILFSYYISVFDADVAKMETLLGKSVLHLADLPPFEKISVVLQLSDASTGSIEVEYEYVPLSVAVSEEEKAAAR
jgi:hypothetical protein